MFPRSIVFNKKHHWQKNVMKLQPLMINYGRWQFNGFKHFLEFSPRKPGEMIHFDDCAYFSNGLVKNHQLESHQVLAQLFFFETGAPTPWVRTLTLILTMPSTTCLVMTDGFFFRQNAEKPQEICHFWTKKRQKTPTNIPQIVVGETCCDKQHQKMIEDERRLQYF